MKKILLAFTLIVIIAEACNTKTEVEEKNKSSEKLEKIESLELKLDATEAQLLNIRTELAKCKGDTISQ